MSCRKRTLPFLGGERKRAFLKSTFVIAVCSLMLICCPVARGQNGQCAAALQQWTPKQHKEVYRVGVLAIRGFDDAFNEFNTTFGDYLTATAGARFDQPIRFEMKALNFTLLFTDVDALNVDFIYVNPSAYSCIESEYGAYPLVSQISRRHVGGNTYDLTQFGGVVFTKADSDVNTVRDIKGKSVACASISGLGSGQTQFRLLQRAGLSYINDPKQVVFTSDQGSVVNGVLNGEFDVGFVRTDQIEQSVNKSTGELVDPSLLKIIDAIEGLEIDGEPFPFNSSTQLYPEWNVAALTHVPDDVATEVQQALLALVDHADVGAEILACYETLNCTNTTLFDSEAICEAACQTTVSLTDLRCDTTVSLALLAEASRNEGKYAGFRSTLSYMELRNMQEEVDFISKGDETGIWQCVRSSAIYDAIVCPLGHFKKSEEEVANGCAAAGIPCQDTFQCVCSPCVKAFDVDVFEASSADVGCAKLDVCGETEQRKSIVFRAVDNKKREGLNLVVRLHEGTDIREIQATPVMMASSTKSALRAPTNDSYVYEFEVVTNEVGVVLIEVLADGEQIPESPLRLEINERNCARDYNDALRVPDTEGDCGCSANSVDISGKCVSFSVLLPSILVPLVVVAAICVYMYVEHKRKQADSLWAVKTSELFFGDPPEVIGRGTFGLVLLAEYRGTQVAVKRVIPPHAKSLSTKGKKNNAIAAHLSADGSVALLPHVDKKNSELEQIEMGESRRVRRRSLHDISGDAFNFGDEMTNESKILHSRPASENSRADQRMRRSSMPTLVDDTEADTMQSSSIPRRHSDGTIFEDAMMPKRKSFEVMGSSPFDFDVAYAGPFRSVDSSVDGLDSGRMDSGLIERSKRATESAKTDVTRSGLLSGSLWDSGNSGTSSGSRAGSVKSWSWYLQPLRWSNRDEYSKLKADFISEMRLLSKLRHPCITTVMGAVISKQEDPMLVMEYMDHGSLYDILHNETMVIEGEVVLPILRDITQGMRFLHAAKPQVVHGDLKAQNVLVDSKFRAKVADFGLSQKKRIGATGTPLWMAPELLRGETDNTAATDVYSFGIILYEMYSRKDPYEGENLQEVLRLIADPKINKRPPIPPACPAPVATLMSDCLVGPAESRPKFEELDLRLKRLDVKNVEPGPMTFSLQKKKVLKAVATSDFLDQLFPLHIAAALREGRKVEPESRDCVTIFFSDIVGFTTISSLMSPMKVSDMLDRLYLRFDRLSLEHDVFKVETIGDAYMAATNLVKNQPDHVKRIAQFAIDTLLAANETLIDLEDHSKGYVVIRVGFHSGPVVANVVGSRHPKYSIFGDTVNCASRMESNSLPGRIQCSSRSAALLERDHPDVRIVSRGMIEIKGKGEMHTYWVDEDQPSEMSSTPVDTGIQAAPIPVKNTKRVLSCLTESAETEES